MDPNSKPVKSTKNVLATAASLAASAMLVRSLVHGFLPVSVLRTRFSARHAVIIEEMEGWSRNLVYDAVETYLATEISASCRRVRVGNRSGNAKNHVVVSLEQGGETTDWFEGHEFKWRLRSRVNNIPDQPNEINLYELEFDKTYDDVVLDKYLPYVLDRARVIKAKEKELKIFLNEHDGWRPIRLHHPATFDTMAMDSDVKRAVMSDLAMFAERKDHYKKIGKAWKRRYLISGPPGSGKSSLVAAMANYLKFDIFDLELAEVNGNSTLRRLMIGVGNKSMLVIEDIDCADRLLSFVDGLWSSCGKEQIVVFTTNYEDRFDPAMLRPGRIDVHVRMGYCGASAFRTLAYNYHDVDHHPLFGEIEESIGEAKVTPAEVAGELGRSSDADDALMGLVELLREKRVRVVEAEDTSNFSHSKEKYCNGNSFQGRFRDGPPTVFRGRGGYMPSFRGRGGRSQSFRGRGGRVQTYLGGRNGGRMQNVKIFRGGKTRHMLRIQ